MFFIHKIAAISPVDEKPLFAGGEVRESADNKLFAIEPAYDEIPRTILRRMAKAVRLAVGAALRLLKDQQPVDGIILGTANGGMEESIKFMNQIVQYEEGMLTPGNFVQSTPNGLAAQIAMIEKNHGYNITHTHRGLSFENALLDADDLLKENPEATYLLVGADEISTYNFNIDQLAGWYRAEITPNKKLFESPKPGSIAGEGAAAFRISAKKENAIAQLKQTDTLHCTDPQKTKSWFQAFIARHVGESPTILMTGDGGDSRFEEFYTLAESCMSPETCVLRFKHLTGEFATASALGFYLGCHILEGQKIPEVMIKRKGVTHKLRSILIYNNYHGLQHSVVLLQVPDVPTFA